MVGAIPLAYAVIVSGALIHNKRLNLRTDLSYGTYIYACPIQQVLVIAGLGTLNPLVFAIIATAVTLPFAAMSWFLVEKPAMRLKSRITQEGGPASDLPDQFPRCRVRATETIQQWIREPMHNQTVALLITVPVYGQHELHPCARAATWSGKARITSSSTTGGITPRSATNGWSSPEEIWAGPGAVISVFGSRSPKAIPTR